MAREIKFPTGLFGARDRDDQADREVATILAELPRDHLARRAFARGRTTTEITNHLSQRRDLFHRLMNVSWDHYRRTVPRSARSRTFL
jgi:hypothetical protein